VRVTGDATGILSGVNPAQVDGFLRQLAQLDPADLRSLLGEVYGFQSYEGDRTIHYSNQSGHGLSLTYLADKRGRNPHGVVQKLQRAQNLTATAIIKLRELYDMASRPQGDYLDSTFHFSHRRVAGWWRYRDQFQILPPPEVAPVPTELLGDWPFLVEARYSSPNLWGFISRRRMQTRNEECSRPVDRPGRAYLPGDRSV
jgi:hypothetical protein